MLLGKPRITPLKANRRWLKKRLIYDPTAGTRLRFVYEQELAQKSNFTKTGDFGYS
jgi:hypothetical protein